MSGDIKPCHIFVLLMLIAAALATVAARGVWFGLTLTHSKRPARFGIIATTTRKPLRDGGAFVVTLAIGTPPRSHQLEVDTGSDLIWTQTQCFQESSSTLSLLACDSPLSMCAAEACPSQGYPCVYNYTYGDGGDSDWTSGILAVDTFTFGSTAVPGVAFGCSNTSSKDGWNGTAGLVGLGRGRPSLVSQLGAGRFSYCLTPLQDTNSTSALLIGPSAALINDTGRVRSTPLVAGPPECRSTFYCLSLTGITLGSTMLSIPHEAFSSRTDGTGVIFVDSGTTFTSLVDTAYRPVRTAVRSLVALPSVDGSNVTGLDLCFQLPSSAPPAMPNMTFHFSGADMVLPAENYMFLDSGMWCLAMEEQAAGDEMSIFGNYQQQNMHILFDVESEMLSFAPAKCSTL